MANPQYGAIAVFKLADSGAVLQDVSAYLTSAGLAEAVDEYETSHIGTVDFKTYIAGLASASIPLAGNLDVTIDGQLAGIRRKSVAWEYYPFGNSGSVGTNVKYNGTAFYTSYDKTTAANSVSQFSVTLRVDGVITRSLV
jgi:hypothetical protein